MKLALLGAVAAIEVCAAYAGEAQAAAQADGAKEQPPGAAQPIGLEEIVVTAERRAETVQRSSLSIEVFSGDRLQSVTKPTDLTALTPGLQIGTAGPQPQAYVRGVGDITGNSRGQSAVAFNVDGVYYARGTQVGPSMFDVSRIEVLKGPQGTLYGRNASGGAINIITNSPGLDDFSGVVNAEVGNFNNRRLDGAVNLPLGDKAALRVAGQTVRRDGYTSDGGQDEHTDAVRAKLLWEPTDTVSLLFSGDASHVGGVGSGVVVFPSPNGDPWRSNVQAPFAYPFQFGAATRPLTAPNDRMMDSDNLGASVEANVDLGFAKLTVLPAYRKQEQLAVYYSINFRYAEDYEGDQSSLELRLSNETDRLKWVGGLYYFVENQDIVFTATQGSLIGGFFDSERRSTAAFAQGALSLTDNLRVILGGRYTEETMEGGFGSGVGAVPTVPFVRTTGRTASGEFNSHKFNYKVGVEYDVAPQSMLFATYATGFKAGGFTSTLRCGADPFDPEELSAFTAGSRNRFLDNRLQVNAEAFYWEYEGQQITFITVDNCGLDTSQLIRNSGGATIKGGNIEVVWRPTVADTLSASVEFNDAAYDSFIITQRGIGQFGPGSGSLCASSATPGRAGFFNIDCTGQELARTPKWAGTLAYEHLFPMASGELRFTANAQFASERWLDYSYLPNGRAPAYSVYNARLNYTPAGGQWDLGVYVNNITDEAVYTSGGQVGATAPNGYRYYTANILAPRMYGARLSVKF